ncbi:hypothetical protein BB560_002058 [Smittium megazygosporum]|uniref:V-type proton ATPase subunit a n=1 Tax=Smittium megazygosporum TaxID=133381 RepID=A0A2T9ZFY0_9FUNG|nr:hypothetical protein BB560_002058 [Smittium megazygosporum]
MDSLFRRNNSQVERPNSMFRSERMSFIRIFIPLEISRFVVTELGEAGIVQFKDLNEKATGFQRTFTPEIRRFEDIERKLNYFHSEIAKEAIPISAEVDSTFAYRPRGPQELEEMEEVIFEYDTRLRKLTQTYSELSSRWMELVLNGLALYEVSMIFQKIRLQCIVYLFGTPPPNNSFSLLKIPPPLPLELRPNSFFLQTATWSLHKRPIGKSKRVTHHQISPTRNPPARGSSPTDVLLSDFSRSDITSGHPLQPDLDDHEGETLLGSRMVLGHGSNALRDSESSHRRSSIGSLEDIETDNMISNSFERTTTVIEVDDINVRYVAGVVKTSRLVTLEKVLWRSLRGNMYMEYADLAFSDEDLLFGAEAQSMSVFLVFAPSEALQTRISKISQSFGATLYDISKNSAQRAADMDEISMRKSDMLMILSNSKEAIKSELLGVASKLSTWDLVVHKEKAIYNAMNMFNFDEGRLCLIADGWCPSQNLEEVRTALRMATSQSGSTTSAVVDELSTTLEPPTYIKTNKFTLGFQNLIDSYGIPKYGEVNPGLFTVVTFPFLFALMFGDFGHGIIMTIAALFLVLRERSLSRVKGEEFSMLFSGRYLLLMMGIYSTIVGLIYNDTFSRAMHIFSPGWTWPSDSNRTEPVTAIQKKGYIYPFGIDPTWHHSDNALLFLNSYKMKLSILIGVVHMIFGMILQVFNARHFHKSINIKHIFLPQVIFFLSIFGYLCFAIVYKWSIDWYALDSNGKHIRNSPPSLLNMLIYMFLNPGSVNPKDKLFPGQGGLQLILLLLAIACIPWMLLAKPLILKKEHNKILAEGYAHINSTTTGRLSIASEDSMDRSVHRRSASSMDNSSFSIDSRDSISGFLNGADRRSSADSIGSTFSQTGVKQDDFDFSDILINSIIHTIEFCLSGISHTASYLRLWALSLAHAQLSQVLWQMTLQPVFLLEDSKVKPLFIAFAFLMWFFLTIGILLIMESLSAFLHALRLHWVEFNSKFYEGSGYKFEPFAFRDKSETF